MTITTRALNDGHGIPTIGMGTGGLSGQSGVDSIASAIGAGYRLLDTALNYGNEREVGKAVRASSVPREELVVTTKLPGRHHGFDSTLESFEESRTNLGLDYVDLYLIHWPLPRIDKFVDSWRAMIELRERGLARSIGVSNFTKEHITRLIDETGIVPAVNEVELHPRFPQADQRAFHAEHGIVTMGWSPLGKQSTLRSEAVITDIASSHDVTPSQAVLRWHVQLGSVPIPKSGNPTRQAENLDVFDFELSGAEISAITSLESGRLKDTDPNTFEQF